MSQKIIRVGKADGLGDGQAFVFPIDGSKTGFVFRFNGRWFAYENVCRHVSLPLDYGDGRFFSRSGRFLHCQNHGAEYDPETGVCVRGPCQGAALKRLAVEETGGEIRVTVGSEAPGEQHPDQEKE